MSGECAESGACAETTDHTRESRDDDEPQYPVIVPYPSSIRIGDFILFRARGRERPKPTRCRVIEIRKGARHSREAGWPYTFVGEKNDLMYDDTFHRDVIKFVHYRPARDDRNWVFL